MLYEYTVDNYVHYDANVVMMLCNAVKYNNKPNSILRNVLIVINYTNDNSTVIILVKIIIAYQVKD